MQENKDVYVSVFGNKNELIQLHDFLDSPNCSLWFDETNKRCFLTACRFLNLTDKKLMRIS